MASKALSKEGVNVQVLLRCRPRNDSEGSTPQVVRCLESRNEVVLDQSLAGKQVTRTFRYDKVFCPAATQADLYQKAIVPIVDEVLEGFNCTIFAYGQTGTGKTYTMEGGSCKSLDGRALSKDAGVIPRAINQIFTHLESIRAESSVQVSFMEVYNEELTDLLAVEEEGDARQKLKIVDDKSGVLVNGLENYYVKNAAEIFAVVEQGSAKRTTAETLLNKRSSRSHSIFTITIHIRETTSDGEDVLKVGKLNLVDLAGSENISRSGAKEGRAREAASINQSLLTLGRVITALVEQSGHIPYRDSKLTRLLRDSLGGRTKTCIIATIAPTNIGLEETLNTLDYAHRAKNIRNRPEVNQRISKGAMICELTTEIEKLKEELFVQRTKKGVFIPAGRYHQAEEQLLGLSERLNFMEERMQAKADEMTELEEHFKKREAELEGQIQTLQAEHLEVQEDLEEERFVSAALRCAEDVVAQHAASLADEVHRMAQEFNILFSKLDLFAAMDSSNRAVAIQLKQFVADHLATMHNNMAQMLESHHSRCTTAVRSMKEIVQRGEKDAKRLKAKHSELQSRAYGQQKMYTTALNELHREGKTAMETMMASTKSSMEAAESVAKDAALKSGQAFNRLCSSASTHTKELKDFTSAWKGQVATIVSTGSSGHTVMRAKLSGVKRSADELCAKVEQGIDASRSLLDRLVQQYQQSWERAGRELCQTVNGLMSMFSKEMQESLENVKRRAIEEQQKCVNECVNHGMGIEAISNGVLEQDQKFARVAATFFDSVPASKAGLIKVLDDCMAIGKEMHTVNKAGMQDHLSVIKSHHSCMKTVSTEAKDQASERVNRARETSHSAEHFMKRLRRECDEDIARTVQKGEASLQRSVQELQEGRQAVVAFAGLETAAGKDLIHNTGSIVEEKLKWDDGVPELPQRREGALPQREFIDRLCAGPREVLCREYRSKRNMNAGLKDENAPDTYSHYEPQMSSQVLEQVSSASQSVLVKAAAPKIQLSGGDGFGGGGQEATEDQAQPLTELSSVPNVASLKSGQTVSPLGGDAPDSAEKQNIQPDS